MIAAKATRAKIRTRNRLMTGGAMGMAIGALLLVPQQARAQTTIPGGQAFQGNAQVVSGNATVVQTAAQDTITVNSSQAVINWTPNDRNGTGTIDFLPQGLRGLFQGDADFTVLNRIVPLDGNDMPIARMIALNGIIDSQINSASGLPAQGGSVWFYSPGGILVGGTSVINVGSLLLTSRDIDATGGLFAPDGTIRFRNPSIAGANGAIEIDVLARINARNSVPGSAYVAMVAPRVVQAGTVRSDGAIALVAAEEADIRINRGLFDIVVTTGSSDSNGIVHTGSSTGPSDTSTLFENRAYLVAVPKNQAMTMLLSGTIGFETASSVSIAANGGILLSAGANVLQGSLVPPTGNVGTANISITDSRFANNVAAIATGTINARPNQSCAPLCSATNPAGQLLFGGNASFAASGGVNISIGQAQRMTVAGSLLILSARPGQGGSASLTIDNAAPPSISTSGGGLIQVAGAVLIDASAGGNPATGAATGGTATLSVNGGRLSAGAISVLAGGSARVGTSGDGADGRGGTAGVNVENGGILNTGALTVAATGRGSGPGRNGQFIPFLAANGGDGIGGTATVVIDNANLSAAQGLTVSANGFGATGSQSSGNGSGGTASISTDNNGGSTSLIAGSVQVQARGEGGGSGFDQATSTFFTSPSGGDATGGRASFAASDTATSTVTIGFLSVDAGARGGTGSDSSNPPLGSTSGGDALGGIATFALNGTTPHASINQIVISAAASGGGANSPSGTAGNGTGGSASMALAAQSNLQSSTSVTISADGSGGEGTDVSGNGIGGSASADFADSASFDTAALRLSASGIGGGAIQAQQSFAPVTTVGGDGTGGIVSVSTAGFLTIADLDLDANGFGGTATPPANPVSPLIGGDATGGSSQFIQNGGFLAAGTVDVRANATAGGSSFPTGTSGAATGGSASFASSAGTVNLTELSIETIGRALSAGGGTMLAQLGGTAALATTGGLITIDGRATLDASGGSVGGGFADTAALTSGGIVTVDADIGGSIAAGTIDLFANADASGFGTVGGDARGGTITVRAANGSSIATLSGLTATASGSGGTAEQGGQGIGGSIDLTADGGSLTNSASIFLSANGESGRSLGDFASPDGRGGAVTIRLTDTDGSQLTFAGVQITADGRIGSGFSSFGPSTPPGGGDGIGGTVNILVEGGTLTGTSFAASASGYGTGGGLGQGGAMNYAQSGGDVTLSFLSIGASGFGGASPFDEDNSDAPGVGGLGQGGTVTLDFSGGTFSADFANAFADGRGGNGHQGFSDLSNGEGGQLNFAGDGGEGNGGSIDVTIDGDADVGSNFLSFSAEGSGGNGGNFNAFGSDSSYTPGRGGNGSGGDVTIDLLGGNSTAAEIAAFANGRGGDAGQAFTNEDGVIVFAGPANHPSPDGGNANGGNALIRLAGTTVSGTLSANASASAGEGGSILSGFTGGTGRGGLAEITIDGVTGLSVPVNIIADGFGGRGGRPNQGEGGDGGDGFGGTARLTAINGADFAFDNSLSSNTDLRASGYGGDGRNARVDNSFAPVATGFDGGDGGDGRAGTIELSAIDSNLTIAAGSGQGTNTGFGGLGGDGASNTAGDPMIPTFGGNGGSGGDGYGGDLRLVAIGGTLSGGSLSLQAGGQRADGGRGGFGNVTSTTDPLTGVVTFFGGDGSGGFSGFTFGGSVRLEAGASESGPGLIDVTSLAIDVSGDVGGRAELIDNSSGPGIALGAFTMVNGNNGFSFCGALPLCGSGLYVSSRDGAITIDGNVDLNLVGGFQVDAFGTGGLDVGGNLSVIVGLDIIARHEGREDSATIEANDIVFGGGPIDLQTGTLVRTTSGSIDLTSGSFISFDTLDSALDIFMDAGSTIIGGELVSDSVATALAGGTIDFGRAVAGDFANLVAGGRLRVGELTVTRGNAELTGNGVTLDSGDVATTLTVRAQNGDAVIGTVTSGAFADINALQDVSITSLTTTGLGTSGGSSAPTAAIIVNSGGTVTLGSLNSADTISITADLLAQATGASQSIGPGGSSMTAVGAISVGTVQDIDFGAADGAAITLVSTGGDIRFGTTTSDVDTRMTATVGSINGTSVTTADGDATLIAGNRIALDNANVGDALSLSAGLGGITLGTSISGYDTLIDSDGNVSIVSATTTDIGATAPTSTANIVIIAAGNVDSASLTSAENITIDAAALTNATSSIVATGNVDIDVDTAALFGTLTAGSLLVDAGTGITFGSSSTIGSTSLIAGTGIGADSLISSSGGVSATSSGGVIDIGTARAAFDLTVTNSGGGVRLGSATSTQSGIFIDASGTVDILNASSAGQFDVASDADIVIGTATSFGDTILDAGTTITVTSLTTTGQTSSNSSAPTNAMIRLTAGGDVTIGTLDSIGDVTIGGDNLLSSSGGGAAPAGSSILAGGDIAISTTQAAQFGLADADGSVSIATGDALGFTTISAGQSVTIGAGTIVAPTSLIEAGGDVSVSTSGVAGLGEIDGAFVLIDSGDGIGFSAIAASDGASLLAELDIVGGTIAVANGSLAVSSAEGRIAILSASAANSASFTALTDVTLASLTVTDGSASVDAGGDVTIDLGDVAGAFASDSGGNTLIGTLTSGGASAITADGNVDIALLTTGVSGGGQSGLIAVPADISIIALGNVTLGELDSANDIGIDATSLFGATSVITAAGDVSLIIDTSASFGTIDAGSLIGTAGTSIDFTSATTIGTNSLGAGTGITGETQTSSGGSVFAFTNGGTIVIDSIHAGLDATVTNFGGGVTLGSIQTQFGDILVDAVGGVEISNANSAGQFEVFSDADIAVGTATSFGDTILDAGTTITVTSLTTTGQSSSNSSAPTNAAIRLTAGGDVTIGTLDAIGSASIDAANLVMAPGNGEVPATSSILAGEQISIIVDHDATFGMADAGGDVTIAAPGTLSFASISADGSAFITAGLIAAASSTVDADLNIFIDNDADSELGTLNGGFVSVTSDVGIAFDSITGNDGASLFAQRDIVGGTISTPGGTLSVTSAEGGIAISNAASGGDARFFANGDATLASLTVADGSVFIGAGGDIRVDLATIADAFVANGNGNIDIGALTSGGTSSIDAAGDILVTQLTTTGLGGSQNSSAPAGANILLSAGGIVALGSIDSAERISIVAASLTGTESSIDAAGLISIDTIGAAQFGTLAGNNGAAITTGSTLTFGSSTTIGSTSISAGGSVNGGALRSEFGVLDVTTTQGSVTLASAYAGHAVDFDVDDDVIIAGALTVAAPQSDQVNSARFEAGGDVSIDSGDIGGALTVRSGGDVSFANSFAIAGDANVSADGVIAVAGFTATQSNATSSTPALAGNIRLDAGSLLTLNGTTSAQGNVMLLGGDIGGAERLVQAGGDITVFGTGTVVLGTLDGGLVSVRSNDSVTFSDILARNGTTIEALQDIDGGSIDTGGNLSVNSAEGSIDLTRVGADIDAAFTAGDGIAIGELVTDFGMATADALGDIRIDNGAVGGSFSAASGGDTVIGELTSGGPASIDAGDGIVITRLTTTGLGGGQNSSAPTSANILLSAGGVVTLGTLDSAAGVVIDASSLGQMGGGETPASSIVAIDDVLVTTAGTADIGSVDAMRLDIDSGGSVSLADSTTQSWTRIRAGGDIDAQDLVSVAASVVAMSATGSIAIDSVQSAGSSSFVASGSVELGSVETEFGSVDIGASNDVDIGTAEIGGSLFVFAGDDATVDTATANGFIIVNAGGEIAAGSLTTTGAFVSGTEDLPPIDDDTGGGDTGGGGTGGGDPDGGDGGDGEDGGGDGDPGGDPIAFASILLSSSDATTVAALDSAGGIIISADTLGGAASSIAAVDTIDITTRGNAVFGTLDGGSNAVISAGGDLTFVDSSTADSTVITTIGTISGGSLESRGSSLTASSAEGNIDIGTIVASQAISLTALSGQVSGDIADSRFGTILIDAATVDYGELESAGTILVRASGDVAIDFAQTNGEGGSSDGEQNRLTGKIAGADALVPPAGSDIIVAAGGSLTAGEFVSAEDIIIDGASLIGANSSMTAEGIIDIDVTGNAEFGSLSASGNRLVVEADGAVTGNLVNTKAADSTMRITGANGITIATIRAADQLDLAAPGGRVMVGDLRAEFVDVTGQAIDLTATDSVFIDFARATAGDVMIRGTAGTLDVNDSQASGSILLRSSNGELLVGRAQASGIDLQSDASIVLRGQAIATQGFAANARNSFAVGGTSAAGAVASGGTVNIVSGDIAIAANGRIGTAGTTTELRLTNGNNGRQTFIGGADTTAGYSLSATELSRLFSGNITVRGSNFTNSAALVSAAPGTATIAPSGNPNVVIDSFTLTGGGASGGNLGAAGTFRIEAPGFARVIGTATLNNLTSDNRFVISAERAVQVIMGQGAIRLNGANGLAGTLLFDADDVVVATASAISDIAALTDSAAIDERLAQNDGVLGDEGALSAGTIAFAVDNGVYVQNSGDGDGFDDRRGFTAGAGGVDIVTRQSTSSQGSPRIVINGRIDDGAGSFLTGVDAFGRVTINEVALTGENQIVSGIDQGSTLNGCLIASASNCFAFEVDVIPPSQNNPLIDEEDEESEQSEGDDSLSVTTVIEVKEVEKLPNEPLIDDPVTGSPNDDLWVPTEG